MAPSGGGESGNLISTIVMFGAIFVIFYFMIIRPQQKRSKEREKMLSNIAKGDKVVTSFWDDLYHANGGSYPVPSNVYFLF